MATSPSPNSQPSAVPPPQLSTPSTPPPQLSTHFSPPPSFQPEANSPSTMANSSVSPSTNSTAPPPSTQSPPAQQPVASPAPLVTPSPPPVSGSPPPASAPPPVPVSPPPIPSPTTNSPPPSSPNPPVNPQPTPTPSPSADSPPSPSSNPPSVSPPPRTDPPHPSQTPSQNSPPSPSSQPPQTTTPPTDSPPQDSPPAPSSAAPNNATPPTFDPPPPLAPDSQPSPNSSARPVFPVSAPPPSGLSPPSLVPPSPSQVQVPPSGIPTVNNSIPNAPSGNGGIGTGVAVAIGAVLGFILLSVIGAAVWYTRKQKKKVASMPTSLSSSPNTDSSLLKAHRSPANVESRTPSEYLYSPSEPGGLGNSRPWFTYEALVEATNGFSAENLLGEGGFGSVYKGYLPDGQEVAVKQLKIGGGQGEREFKAEVEIISRIHHRHLVSLAGYCISDDRRLLVYEFVPNNTLHFHLHGADRPVMTWETRVRVAAGAARGIAYLHEDCHPRIIHRDIKTANILLDNNFEARVSDFGLAKLAVDANSHVTTRVMGTFGYMAPEYASSGKLTEKSDVFSFGVVLLELITGRRPVDTSQPLGEESLVEWARPQLSDALATKQFEDLVDPRLEKNYVNSEMFRVIEAAAACVRHSATKRPSMGQVVRAFDSLITADLSNGMQVGESAIYDSAEQSAEIRLFQRMAFGTQDYSTDFFSQGSWHS